MFKDLHMCTYFIAKKGLVRDDSMYVHFSLN